MPENITWIGGVFVILQGRREFSTEEMLFIKERNSNAKKDNNIKKYENVI